MRGSSRRGDGKTRALYCLLSIGGNDFWGGGWVVVGVWRYRGLNYKLCTCY